MDLKYFKIIVFELVRHSVRIVKCENQYCSNRNLFG